MKMRLFFRYLIVVLIVTLTWWFSRDISPRFFTLIGLCLIVAATIWLIVSITRSPQRAGDSTKSWWRLVKDAFWGL